MTSPDSGAASQREQHRERMSSLNSLCDTITLLSQGLAAWERFCTLSASFSGDFAEVESQIPEIMKYLKLIDGQHCDELVSRLKILEASMQKLASEVVALQVGQNNLKAAIRNSFYECAMSHRADLGTPPSIGSILHGSGRCVPCMFKGRCQGCATGLLCYRCHHESHDKTSKKQKQKCSGSSRTVGRHMTSFNAVILEIESKLHGRVTACTEEDAFLREDAHSLASTEIVENPSSDVTDATRYGQNDKLSGTGDSSYMERRTTIPVQQLVKIPVQQFRVMRMEL